MGKNGELATTSVVIWNLNLQIIHSKTAKRNGQSPAGYKPSRHLSLHIMSHRHLGVPHIPIPSPRLSSPLSVRALFRILLSSSLSLPAPAPISLYSFLPFPNSIFVVFPVSFACTSLRCELVGALPSSSTVGTPGLRRSMLLAARDACDAGRSSSVRASSSSPDVAEIVLSRSVRARGGSAMAAAAARAAGGAENGTPAGCAMIWLTGVWKTSRGTGRLRRGVEGSDESDWVPRTWPWVARAAFGGGYGEGVEGTLVASALRIWSAMSSASSGFCAPADGLGASAGCSDLLGPCALCEERRCARPGVDCTDAVPPVARDGEDRKASR